jgi:hypothetical protein
MIAICSKSFATANFSARVIPRVVSSTIFSSPLSMPVEKAA